MTRTPAEIAALIERAKAYRPYNALNDGLLVRELADALAPLAGNPGSDPGMATGSILERVHSALPAPAAMPGVATDEMLVAAMRAFEPLSSVLRYREKDGWHACDIAAMRAALQPLAQENERLKAENVKSAVRLAEANAYGDAESARALAAELSLSEVQQSAGYQRRYARKPPHDHILHAWHPCDREEFEEKRLAPDFEYREVFAASIGTAEGNEHFEARALSAEQALAEAKKPPD